MTTIPTVDIGVACRDMQGNEWWTPLLGECIALTEGRHAVLNQVLAVGSAMTDYNQTQIADLFLKGKSDWLYMIEDDTVHPKRTLLTLLAHGVPFVSGLYFATNPPHNPIAYWRNTADDEQRDPRRVFGTYRPVTDYERGEIFEVDSVGMGCALIHRSVFESIRSAHILKMRRRNATIVPVLRSALIDETLPAAGQALYRNAVVDELVDLPEGDVRPFPFYVFEHGRTQDHWFCELAASVGVRPLLDTSIECQHFKRKPTSAMHHRVMSDQYLEKAQA